MTKIKEVIEIKNKKIMYSVFVLLLLTCGLSIGMLFSSPMVFKDVNNLRSPKSSADEITVITPENKTYFQPDSGYYPATYGFENDELGSIPYGWVNSTTFGCTAYLISSWDNHKNVLRLHDDYPLWSQALVTNQINRVQGTIELWIQVDNVTTGSVIYIWDTLNNGILLKIQGGALQYQAGTWIPIQTVSINQWYHFKIEFDLNTDWHLWIDGISSDLGLGYSFNGAPAALTEVRLHTVGSEWDIQYFIDAIGYSWDPNYNVGDSMNEGLLLSYDNATNLEWQGYSLDGQANKTIRGNTTISIPADGAHNIQVFGNDTMGTMYESNPLHFTVNTAPPEITINSPTASQVVGSTAPGYDISITGLYDSIWYTLDGGTTNLTASGLTGTLNQAAWTALADGIITITFYANNSAGMEGSAQVQVFKQTSEEPPPTPPGIPGYDLYLLIGTLSVVSALLIRKRVKS